MDIEETEASPVAEETAAPVEQEAVETESGAEEGETALTDELEQYLDDGTDDGTPETVEIEHDGKLYKVPAELKDGFLRHRDYTQKTMSVAEERKAVEAIRAQVEEIRSISGERLQAVVTAQQAHARVQELLETPIDGLSQDQVNALRLDLSDAQASLAHYSQAAEQAATIEQQLRAQQFAKVREEAAKEAALRIPNFNETRRAELDSFVVSIGGKAGAVAEMADPIAWEVLHYADIGKKFLDRERQARKATAAQSVQPATELGGKSKPGAKDLIRDADKMSVDDWMKQRNADLKKAAR